MKLPNKKFQISNFKYQINTNGIQIGHWTLDIRHWTLSRGFTLIELLIVIAIMGVLAAGVLVAIDPVKKTNQANDAIAKERMSQCVNAFNVLLTQDSVIPATADCTAAGTNNELRSSFAFPSNYTHRVEGDGTATFSVEVDLKGADAARDVWCYRSASGTTVAVADDGACIP